MNSSFGCLQHCKEIKKLSGICLILDIKNQQISSDGCFGGFGFINGYSETIYEEISINKKYDGIFDIQAREINDPYYHIPFIIGYGVHNTWGVTYEDRMIIVWIFIFVELMMVCPCICCSIFACNAIIHNWIISSRNMNHLLPNNPNFVAPEVEMRAM